MNSFSRLDCGRQIAASVAWVCFRERVDLVCVVCVWWNTPSNAIYFIKCTLTVIIAHNVFNLMFSAPPLFFSLSILSMVLLLHQQSSCLSLLLGNGMNESSFYPNTRTCSKISFDSWKARHHWLRQRRRWRILRWLHGGDKKRLRRRLQKDWSEEKSWSESFFQ